MKASIKFREDQKPLMRAKVPISILSFPFQSSVIAGESKELSLSLATFFDSGPSLRFSYRPNNSQNPFSFVLKSGLGHFGSPNSSPFTMSAEFSLIGNQNPSFFVHFKPRFGDFCVKKSHSSPVVVNGFVKNLKINGSDSGENENVNFLDKKIMKLDSESPAIAAAGLVENLISGTVVSASTTLPLKCQAVVKFGWGLSFPRDRPTGILFKNVPLLLMNKIGIEQVVKDESKSPKNKSLGAAEVAEACLNVQKQLEFIQAENGLLRNALNDLRAEIVAGNSKESERNRWRNAEKKQSDLNGFNCKSSEDVNEEFKKALKASAGV